MISRTVTAPFDILKLIFQVKEHNDKATLKQEIIRIYKQSGYKGFFKGNGANIVKMVPETALKFTIYDQMKDLICRNKSSPTVIEKLISGATAGFVTQTVVYPLEITKTRLALAPDGYYKGIYNCLTHIIKNEGAHTLYKGWFPSVLGIVPYASIDLTLFNILSDYYIHKMGIQPSTYTILGCASFASVCGQLVAYPFSVVRTKLQFQGLPESKTNYKGIWDCSKNIFRQEGYRGFYRGLLSNFGKTIPAIGISRLIFEKTKEILLK